MRKLSEIFECWYGVNLELINCQLSENGIPFVSRTSNNNGVVARVSPIPDIEPNPPHTLSLAGGGSVLSCFYQDEEYYSGRDLFILSPKKPMTKNEMLLYSYIIGENKYKYNYGRQANRTFRDLILPELSELSGLKCEVVNPNFKFDESPVRHDALPLNTVAWRWFSLNDKRLFIIKGSKTTPLFELELSGEGDYPYITTQATNNGVKAFFNYYTESGYVFTIDSAVKGYCSWHEEDFSASDHVEKLIPRFECNNYIAMFLVTIINMEQYRYNYGLKCSQTRLRNMKIKLPVDSDGNPDWQFMENYIKSLPYSANL